MPFPFKPFPHDLTNYFVIHRRTGTSYDINAQGDYSTKAYSNKATATKPVFIQLGRPIVGLKEKRYRLVQKQLVCRVLYKGSYLPQ